MRIALGATVFLATDGHELLISEGYSDEPDAEILIKPAELKDLRDFINKILEGGIAS